MLVDREAQIMNFKKEKYYLVRLAFDGAEAISKRVPDKANAEKLKAACADSSAVCVSVSREKKTVTPPKLFDLTTLQREANKLYGYTAKQTLDLAQALYEKRLLTYPRTDSSYLTEDMSETAASVATLLAAKLPFMKGADFAPDLSRVLDSKKVSDHHAIFPTTEFEKTELSALPETERNILTLVGARLLFATAVPHIYESVKAVFKCADSEFTATGKTILCDGWKGLERRYRDTLKQKPDEDTESEKTCRVLPRDNVLTLPPQALPSIPQPRQNHIPKIHYCWLWNVRATRAPPLMPSARDWVRPPHAPPSLKN